MYRKGVANEPHDLELSMQPGVQNTSATFVRFRRFLVRLCVQCLGFYCFHSAFNPLDPQTTHKIGYHPIILGVKPIFKGILRIQAHLTHSSHFFAEGRKTDGGFYSSRPSLVRPEPKPRHAPRRTCRRLKLRRRRRPRSRRSRRSRRHARWGVGGAKGRGPEEA